MHLFKMNKKLFIIPILFLVLLFTTSQQVQSYFPDTHTLIVQESCDAMQGRHTPVSRVVCANMREAIAGNIASDISVVFYFTEFQKYEVTHSPLFCSRMIEEARNERQLAFAYGSCMHHPSDSSSHNNLVPYAILHTYQPNYFIHPIAEESINDKIVTPSLTVQTREALDIFKENCESVDDCDNEFIAQLERVLKNDNTYQGTLGGKSGFQSLDVIKLTSLFMTQVQGDTGYELGYASIFAIPTILVIVIVLGLIVGIFLLVFLLRQQNKGFITKFIMIPVVSLVTILCLLALIGIPTGYAFQMYKIISAPITFIVPLGNYNQYLDIGIADTIKFFNTGNTYTILDPTGIGNIKNAESKVLWVWWALIALFSGYLIFLFIRAFRGKGKKKKK